MQILDGLLVCDICMSKITSIKRVVIIKRIGKQYNLYCIYIHGNHVACMILVFGFGYPDPNTIIIYCINIWIPKL